MTEKVNFDQYGIELRKNRIQIQIKTKQQKEDPSGACIDIQNSYFWYLLIVNTVAIHIMFKIL